MRDRLLTRHFLQRFLDNDLISPHADRHETLALVGAVLVTSGAFVSVMLSLKYLFRPFQSPGWTAVVALDDRLLFTSWSMIVMALVALATWDALSLDGRDTAILGPLPIPPAAVVKAKLEAVFLFALGFALALNLASSVLHPLLMVAKLPIGLLAATWLVVVQAGVTMLAGACGFLMIVAARELLRALVGPAGFRRVSSILQAALVVTFATALLLVPALSSRVGQWLTSGTESPFWLPPFWFLGLFETLAGGTIARLPRGWLPPRLAPSEAQSTAWYADLNPLFHQLGFVALAAIVAVPLLAIVAYTWNSRRLSVLPVSRGTTRRSLRTLLIETAARAIVRQRVAQAGFVFTLQCLARSAPHRLAIATAAAAGVAAATVSLRGVDLRDPIAASSSVAFTALQTALIVALALGFRHAVGVPADLRASLTFHLSWAGDERAYLSGVKRAALMALVLPTTVVLFPLHLLALGWPRALLHLAFGLLFGAVMLELLLAGYHRLPFVSAYTSAGNLKSMVAIYALAVLLLIYGVASIERLALASARGGMVLLGVVLLVLVCASTIDARRRRNRIAWTGWDDLPDLDTQRLDLSG